MKLVTCNKCQSQFDVTSMQAGSSFVCGKCRNVLEVPVGPAVVAPIQTLNPVGGQRFGASSPPPTVALSPDEMRRALQAAKAGPKLPAAMEARRQTQGPSRAGGSSTDNSPPPTVALSPDEMRKALAAAKAPAPAAKPAPSVKPAAAKPAAAKAPAATPAAKPAAKPAPSAAPAAKPAAAPAAQRRAAPAPAPEPAAETPARRSRGAADSSGGEKKKSPAMMYGVIGVGVLAAGGAFFALSGKSEPKTPDAPPVAEVPLDEWQKFVKMSAGDADLFVAGKMRDAGTDLAKLEAAYQWFKDPKVAQSSKSAGAAKQAIDAALRADPNAAWAREAKGDKKALEMVQKAKDECPSAFANAEANEKELIAALAKLQTEPWVSAKEYADLEKKVAAVKAREEMLKNSPRLQIAEAKKNWTRQSPLFKDMKWIYVYRDPYLISQQYEEVTDADGNAKKVRDREAKAKWVADTDAIIFQKTYEHWMTLFGEKFKFPRLETTNRVLAAIITWNRESFDEVYRKNNPGQEISGGIRAFYAPSEMRIFHYLGDEAMRSQDEIPCNPATDMHIQKLGYQVAAHEETHQLQHEYTAIFQGNPLSEDVIQLKNRKLMWFEEGIAEFMGAFEIDAAHKDDLTKATFFHNRMLLERTRWIRGSGKAGAGDSLRADAQLWTIPLLMKPNNNPELQAMGEKMKPGQENLMTNLFYARAWGLVHFLWFYDNGKYRPKMLEYLETVLKDQQSAQGFAKIMGRTDPESWGEIGEEYEFYWNRILAKPSGWKDAGRNKYWETDTSAPTDVFGKEEEGE